MKTLRYLTLMCLTLLSFNMLKAQTHWTCNENSYEYDMSAFITVEDQGAVVPNLAIYEVAAFVEEECRGVSTLEWNDDGTPYLYLRIRSNTKEGETVFFKYFNKRTGKEDSFGTTVVFEHRARKGLPGNPMILSTDNNKVTVDASVTGGGSIEGAGTFTIGTKVTLKAVANEGWHFVKWSDGNKNPSISFTLTKNVEIKAEFARNIYKVTFLSYDGKTVIQEKELEFEAAIDIPEAPIREGHTFSTWGDVPAIVPAHDVTFTAQYTVNKYLIKFIAENIVIYEDSLDYGSNIIVPEAPAKEGHTFVTWGDVPATVPANDLTFTAQYKVNKYHITFMAEGKIVYNADLDFGTEISIPEAPQKIGYTFVTWGDVPKTMPAKDVIFTAKYTVNKYKIKFVADSITVFEEMMPYGATIIAPKAPEKEGHTFVTWGDVPETVPANDLTFTAQYKVNKYHITFIAEGNTVFETDLDYGSVITKPEAPAKEGHTFSTWGDVPETMPAKDISFTAQYTVNKYLVKFIAEDKVVKESYIEYGSEIPLPEAPAKEGHTFKTWGDIPETMPAHELSFTAQYTVNKYLVKFVADDVVVSEDSLDYGSKITPPEAPAKEGHTFKSWGDVPETVPAHDVTFTAEYFTNKYHISFVASGETVYEADIDFGAKIEIPKAPAKEGHTFKTWGDVPETMPAKDLAFTAQYTVNKYLVKFIADDIVISEDSLDYGIKITPPEAPEKEGHTFKSWGDVPETVPAHDVTFTAEYITNKYHISFVANGETVYEADIDFGAKIDVPEAPDKEGHTFKTWGEVPETMPAKDLAFTAQYTVNKYLVKFIADDIVILEDSLEYGTKIALPEAPAKEGHTFKTWGDVPETVPAHDVTFTAEYTVNSYTISYYVDGEFYKDQSVEYGTAISVIDNPEREGYTFSGWQDVPEVMPAEDIEIHGSFEVNYYKLTYILNDEFYAEETIAYGSKITPMDVKTRDDEIFVGWEGLPETMPAEDITVYGRTVASGIETLFEDVKEVNIYSINGRMLYKNEVFKDVIKKLRPGIYIINGRKVAVK